MLKFILFCICSYNCLIAQEYTSQGDTNETSIPIAIIGSGPSGLGAAYACGLKKIQTIVFQGNPKLGALEYKKSPIKNWLSIKEIDPKLLLETMAAQVTKKGGLLYNKEVVAVDLSKHPFTLVCRDNTIFKAASIIIATGQTKAKLPILYTPYEGTFIYEQLPNTFEKFKDKIVTVIGSGDEAVEKALILSDYVKHVYILARGTSLKADIHEQEAIKMKKNITILFSTNVIGIAQHNNNATGLIIQQLSHNQTLSCDAAFVAIGWQPNTGLFKNKIQLDDDGTILVKNFATSIPGVFAAGTVCDKFHKHAIIACAQGIQAAVEAIHFVNNLSVVSSK